jgi:pantoate--beta-alanine ligase
MIKVFQKTQEFINWRNSLKETIGLVPTMGNLHQGHLSLAQKSLKENKYTVVTIFVNPKQFAPDEDFKNYPRTLEDDIEKLSSLTIHKDQQLCILAPQDSSEIYPEGLSTKVTVEHPMTKVLCGAFRNGHFDGVTTVVHRLFQLTKPDVAYFGEKDFQQLVVIKQMVKENNLPINITSLPIVRDDDGLALSSRNQYLSLDDKKMALNLSRSLQHIKQELSSASLEKAMLLKDQLVNNDSHWQYLEILDSNDLSRPKTTTSEYLIAGAYILGQTRLIDNITSTKPIKNSYK